jgi:hypothetical protein
MDLIRAEESLNCKTDHISRVPIKRGHLTESEVCFLQKGSSLTSSFIAKSLLKLFILRSKLSALRFAYAQQSYHNRYCPSEKETRTE